MYRFFRPLLFRLDPESAHHLTLALVRLAGALPPLNTALRAVFRPPPSVAVRPVNAFGLAFPNPVGLAAGYDKDGLGWRGLACLGFGHIEIGTVTVHPQPGNPRPRLFRLPEAGALINRMGFPGRGAVFVSHRLQGKRPPGLVLGVNIGKNKDTPLETAAQDYLQLMDLFAPLADYLAVNVSSPNTVGLRRLQARQALEDLLGQLAHRRAELLPALGKSLPVLVKLAPDLSEEELADALSAIISSGMDGVIASNTTIGREELERTAAAGSPLARQAGGLSGAPLHTRSAAMIRLICHLTDGKLPVVGVGGIMSPEDAREKLDAGACLVQVYSGLVYAGPGLVRAILTAC